MLTSFILAPWKFALGCKAYRHWATNEYKMAEQHTRIRTHAHTGFKLHKRARMLVTPTLVSSCKHASYLTRIASPFSRGGYVHFQQTIHPKPDQISDRHRTHRNSSKERHPLKVAVGEVGVADEALGKADHSPQVLSTEVLIIVWSADSSASCGQQAGLLQIKPSFRVRVLAADLHKSWAMWTAQNIPHRRIQLQP